MTKLAFLEYAFMFDPDSTWSNGYDFENKLAEFFKIYGYDANIVDTVRGTSGRRIIFITKIKDLLDDPGKSFREAAEKKKENPIIQEVKKDEKK